MNEIHSINLRNCLTNNEYGWPQSFFNFPRSSCCRYFVSKFHWWIHRISLKIFISFTPQFLILLLKKKHIFIISGMSDAYTTQGFINAPPSNWAAPVYVPQEPKASSEPTKVYIDDENSLRRFLNDQHSRYNADKHYIFLGSKELPNIFSHVPVHETAEGAVFKFNDLQGSYVEVYKKEQQMKIRMKNDNGLCPLNVLDTSYDKYTVGLVVLTDVDIDAIAKWRHAKNVSLTIEFKPRQEIVDRINELAKTMNIQITYRNESE